MGGWFSLAGNHTDNRSRRFAIVALAFALIVVAIVIRYATIMIGTESSRRTTPPQTVERGPILDRRGRLLAVQTRLDTVTAWKPHVENVADTSRALAEILSLDAQALRDRMGAADGFLIVKRTITPNQSERIRAMQREKALPGIRLEPDAGRTYPQGEAAAPIIGFVGVDNVGLSGIEYVLSDQLLPPRAVNGMGNQVFLTLDMAIQSAADDLARRLLSDHQADSVTIVVGEAATGALLAVSALPTFDPNNFADYSEQERRDRFVSTIYEPGSVLKAFSIAAFLELGAIDFTDTFTTTGGYRTADGEIVITDLADYGAINAEEIIKYSSNVGAAYASERVDPGAFYTMMTKFGFGRRTGIDLNGEERGLLAPPEEWSGRTKATIAIGQEIGVTAVQMITAATALANDGILLRPQIIDRIVSPNGDVVHEFAREPIREVLSPTVAPRHAPFYGGGNGTG